jgi:hypothetical protein
MTNFIKVWLDGFFQKAAERKKRAKQARSIRRWEKRGRPVPPPDIVKHNTLKEYAEKYSLPVFVETGTLNGDTVEAVKTVFKKIISVELSETFFKKASERFKTDKFITILQGDSGKLLGSIVAGLTQPALFWLDGHFSGGETARGATDTPILEELKHVLTSGERRHVIVIDDAHSFGVDQAYLSIEELKKFILSMRKDVSISIKDNSIRIVPD